MIRVALPAHLRVLAQVDREVSLEVAAPVTIDRVLDALESEHPRLRGTIRDQQSGKRRPFVRYFACEQDLSHDPTDVVLPQPVISGAEPLLVIGAMAGG